LIRYQPDKLLSKVAPERLIKKLASNQLTLKRATLLSLRGAREILGTEKLEAIALKVLKQYKQTYKDLREETDATVTEAKEEAINESRLMVQRVQDAVVHEVATEIKHKYHGERYQWLPSDSDEPDPEHQLNYGQIFIVGDGEMPGDRFGCRCGMRILVEDEELDLSEEE
jgi:hypothetical protein